MKKIPLKLPNESMKVLIEYLRFTKALASESQEDRINTLVAKMTGDVLYDWRITLNTKYMRYTSKPHFTMNLSIAQAAALVCYFQLVPASQNYEKAIIQTIISKIDPHL